MRILFITATRIGDAVLSTGVLNELGRRHSGAEITVACGPLAASLFRGYPGVARIIILDKQRFGGHWWRLWREVRATKWDLVVDLRRSLIPFLISAKERRTLPRTDHARHRADFLPAVLGIPEGLNPVIFVPAAADVAAAEKLGDANVLAIAPVAARPEKTWPAEKFAETVRKGADGALAGWRVLLIGGPGESGALESLRAMIPDVATTMLPDEPDLLRVAALLKRCRVFLGNDSGISHLAAAVGTPTVALFGQTDPLQYAPRGPHVRVVKAATMSDIEVDTVVTELSALAFTKEPR